MDIDMTRHQGSVSVPCAECTNTKLQTWRVRADIVEYEEQREGSEEKNSGVTFIETEYPYKPSLVEIVAYVTAVKNRQIDDAIIGGYQWQGIPVWLSTENQFNYLMTLILAKLYEGSDLVKFPIIFKLGTDEEPVMHPFQDLQELESFCFGAFNYIQGVLAQGWKDKAAMDFTPYEQALEHVEESVEEEPQEAPSDEPSEEEQP